jgi:Dna[CI] antecedent DciA-like protein
VTLRRIGETLTGWSPSADVADDSVAAIAAAWSQIVGPEVGAHSRPVQIVRDALIVATRSSAWSQQLSFLSEAIVRAVRERMPATEVRNIRFRVGRTATRATSAPEQHATTRRPRVQEREPARDSNEALARFRDDVRALGRAKRAAGWNQCEQCGVWVTPTEGSLCITCVHSRRDARAGNVARLLFEAPWLGYSGIANLVEGLNRAEYERIRKRVLMRWWEALARSRRSGKLSRDGRERLIASSYVLLKSGVAPEEIAPATVRNLLGDDLHDLLYKKNRTQ